MPPTRRPRPPLLLRITIVIGATTFLLGLSAAVALAVIRDRSPASDDRRVFVGLLRLDPAPTPEQVEVELRWEDGDAVRREPAQASRQEPGLWLVNGVPPGWPVEVEVFRLRPDGRRVFLVRVPVRLAEDEVVEIALPR